MQKLSILIFLFMAFAKGYCQLSISGTQCVSRGSEYEYTVSGLAEKATMMNICLKGGVIAGTSNTCSGDTILSQVRVIWDNDTAATAGSLTVTTGKGVKSFSVSFVSPVYGGKIDNDESLQQVDSTAKPSTIKCSKALQGNCDPKYVYQWESSTDAIRWTAIKDAVNQTLSFKDGLHQSTYFRRKVTEENSSSVGYSNVATVVVNFSLY